MDDILRLARIQIGVILTFVFCKALLRPLVLGTDLPQFLKIFVLSYPNFCEAIVGTMTLTGVGLIVNARWIAPGKRLGEPLVYAGATLAAAVFVILQELGVHDLGGRNVSDPWDVLFSVVGLFASYALLLWIEPEVTAQ